MRAVMVAVVALAGCWSASQPAWTAPPTTVDQGPLPECPIRLTETGHLIVWEVDLGSIAPAGTRRLAVYQTGTEAYVALGEADGPGGSDTLWKVSCAGRMVDSVTIAGADFGNAALHADRRRLFYSHGGVAMLDLASRTHSKLTTPPSNNHCAVRDTVRGATRDHVEFSRGGPCGGGGEDDATLMRRHLASGVEEKSTAITGIVVQGDQVWLASGDCGNAAIHRSTDWRTWKPVVVPNVQGRITLVADTPGTLVMATGLCSGTPGGRPATITRDGGATWTSISKDVVIEWVRGPALVELRAGAANGQQMRWSGSALVDLDTVWTDAPALPKTVTIRGRTVRPTQFGLYDAATDERLFPR